VLVGDRTALFSIDMTGPAGPRTAELSPGVHVLENKPLGEPSAKVDYVKMTLGDAGGRPGDELFDKLRGLMRDHSINEPAAEDDGETRRRSKISACCVHAEGYGTRSSMLLRVPRSPGEEPEVWASTGPSCVSPLTKTTFQS
jgi:hypothetical protein